ncbi:MAG: hypothetical protein Q7K54_05230 [Candidatus Parcubacteria bacterium]|nr:hypothetical protein [Candidatus Parcubacteria bacterium]
MAEPRTDKKDLTLPQGMFALVQDSSTGEVYVVVGPCKYSVPENDRPMNYNSGTGEFEECSLQESIRPCPAAGEDQYMVLANPVKEDEVKKHPGTKKQDAVPLDMGKKVNIPGPTTFALFPGQYAQIIGGHQLRSNQYLVVRVVNGEEATKNLGTSVLKPQTKKEVSKDTPTGASKKGANRKQTSTSPEAGAAGAGTGQPPETTPPDEEVRLDKSKPPKLVTGQLLVIKGTEVSFYIPQTGLEVLPEDNVYVRDAVSLEQTEYCILLDEGGDKTYVRGPAVVFPTPTQTFFTVNGTRKFKAIELQDHWGLHVKVIKAYKDGGKEYSEGDEIFITGKDQKVYFPREEHSVIKYGDQDIIHYGIAIPEGEGRYVLDYASGKVKLVNGPIMFLPDPRKEVVVLRGLNQELCNLLYPGNQEASMHNLTLSKPVSRGEERGVKSAYSDLLPQNITLGAATRGGAMGAEDFAAFSAFGDQTKRKTTFTPPRTIELRTKFDGAVAVSVWTGWAIKLVQKNGKTRVVVGPNTALLEYDETLEIISLSTGTPKTNKNLRRDVYLRVTANQVSDVVDAVTKDLVNVHIPVVFRVNFEGDSAKWFNLENYVGYLTDHLRSFIRNVVKQTDIAGFNENYITILRDAILGKQVDKDARSGRLFPENNMRIFDVDLGEIEIGDDTISMLLSEGQRDAVKKALEVAAAERQLTTTQKKEEIARATSEAQALTARQNHDLKLEKIGLALKEALAEIEASTEKDGKGLEAEIADSMKRVDAAIDESRKRREAKLSEDLETQRKTNEISELEVTRRKAAWTDEIEEKKAQIELVITELKEQAEAFVKRSGAINPQLVAAIELAGKAMLAKELTNSLGNQAIFGGKSVVDTAIQLFKGTPIESLIGSLTTLFGESTDVKKTEK